MSTSTQAEQIERNLSLAGAHLRQVVADPSILDGIPDGVTLVFLPADDAKLREANIEMGIDALRRGEDVLFKHVRRAAVERPES